MPRFMLCWTLIVTISSSLRAHEGHAPLPTRGASVDPVTGVIRLSREAAKTLDVQTFAVEPREITDSWFAYATVTSPWNGRALVSSLLPGRIVSLSVQPGQTVTAGETLAEVESQELHTLRQQLLTAKNDVDIAQRVLSQLEPAAATGAVPSRQLVEARTTLRKAENSLAIARQKWFSLGLFADRLKQVLSGTDTAPLRLTVTSPLSGNVIHADLSVGRIVDPQEHLFEVAQPSPLWLQIDVLERDLGRMAVGQSVELSLTAYPGKSWTASIDKLGQLLDPTTHLGVAWATLENPSDAGQALLPGMTGQVRLRQDRGDRRLVVPDSAVLRDGAERYVLVEQAATKEGFEFQKQSVALGQRMGAVVEIRGGNVLPGDRVVTQGSHELASFFAKGSLRLSPETARDIRLEVRPAGPQSIADAFAVDGMVDVPPDRRAVVASPLAGSIDRILVDRVESVRRGDVIAEVRSQELHSLQLDLLQAALDVQLQSELLARLQSAANSVPARLTWEAEAALKNAQVIEASLKQQLQTVGLDEAAIAQIVTTGEIIPRLPLKSPIDGVVVRFDKLLGHVVAAEEPLFEVHDLTRPYIQAFVAEQDSGRVSNGQAVRVRLVAEPGQVLTGRVVRMSQVLGDVSRTLSVWIELEDSAARSWPHNLLAQVSILSLPQSVAVAIPRSAIVEEGTRRFAFVRQSGETFARRAVDVGRSDDQFVEIRGGVKAGEDVAVSGVRQLQTGFAAIR